MARRLTFVFAVFVLVLFWILRSKKRAASRRWRASRLRLCRKPLRCLAYPCCAPLRIMPGSPAQQVTYILCRRRKRNCGGLHQDKRRACEQFPDGDLLKESENQRYIGPLLRRNREHVAVCKRHNPCERRVGLDDLRRRAYVEIDRPISVRLSTSGYAPSMTRRRSGG